MDKKFFVQNVKSFCKLRGVLPTVACRESGAGASILSNIETRGTAPSVEKVQLLAQYLGVTTSELLGEELPPQSQMPTSDEASPEDKRVLAAYKNAVPEVQAATRRLLGID